MKDDKYTLVRHSGTLTGHSEFARAVELRLISGAGELKRVQQAGGLVLDGYAAADDREQSENYPEPEKMGLVPRVRGRFHPTLHCGHQSIYIPPPAVEPETAGEMPEDDTGDSLSHERGDLDTAELENRYKIHTYDQQLADQHARGVLRYAGHITAGMACCMVEPIQHAESV